MADFAQVETKNQEINKNSNTKSHVIAVTVSIQIQLVLSCNGRSKRRKRKALSTTSVAGSKQNIQGCNIVMERVVSPINLGQSM